MPELLQVEHASRRRGGPPASIPTLVIRGGTVVDQTGERRADVICAGGRVTAVGEGLELPPGATVLDASDCFVAPGLVDLHAHLREPGNEEAECISSGARAAALGGFTAVLAMPNTDPPIDSAAVASEVLALGAGAPCRISVAGAITLGRAGEKLAPLGELAAFGVRIFTDDGAGVQDSGVMRRAFEYAHGLGVTLAQHCEDDSLAAGGDMHEGEWSSRLGVPGAPPEAEELMVARDIALARLTGGKLHLLHLSTAGSVTLVAAAKAQGLDVTAEVTPHHLSLVDADLASYDAVFKVNPPLRTPSDVAALREACATGNLDAIATDHAPHPPQAKDTPLSDAAPGMVGLETALAVSIGALCLGDGPQFLARGWEATPGSVEKERESAGAGGDPAANGASARLRVADLVGLMSWRPARISHMAVSQGGDQGGPITPGAPANLCVFDPAETWVVDPPRMASRSRNTPWAGRTLTGRVRHTICSGDPVVIDGEAQR